VHEGPWTDLAVYAEQLKAKLNTYAQFALDGGLVGAFPQLAPTTNHPRHPNDRHPTPSQVRRQRHRSRPPTPSHVTWVRPQPPRRSTCQAASHAQPHEAHRRATNRPPGR
jgi:hypothetical protein